MTEQQDHPGPEWVETVVSPGDGCFEHFGMAYWPVDVTYGPQDSLHKTRESAVARCRAISAAALAWEYRRQCLITESLDRICMSLSSLEMGLRKNQ